MSLQTRLAELIAQEIRQAGRKPPVVEPSTILATTGLDSLGFATLIVAMEREFGLDPFGGSDDIIYPETFGELLDLDEAESGRANRNP